jgi:hypothetical protein
MADRQEMKKLLAMAIFDSGFRETLVSNPRRAVEQAGIRLTRDQLALVEDVAQRLHALDIREFENLDVSLDQRIDLATGNPIGPVAGHASTGVSW